MISKKYRLTEREVKKVLRMRKPFFSSGVVLNSVPNKEKQNRFGIVIWAKSVDSNISRNFFRRRFYDRVQKIISTPHNNIYKDYVFVVKKQTKLSYKNQESCNSFLRDIQFLIRKM
jgi:ribonuclease P protein component